LGERSGLYTYGPRWGPGFEIEWNRFLKPMGVDHASFLIRGADAGGALRQLACAIRNRAARARVLAAMRTLCAMCPLSTITALAAREELLKFGADDFLHH